MDKFLNKHVTITFTLNGTASSITGTLTHVNERGDWVVLNDADSKEYGYPYGAWTGNIVES